MDTEKKTKGKKIADVLTSILAILVIIIAIPLSIMAFSAKDDGVPKMFGYSPYSIPTESMKGTIEPGDLIICKMYDGVSKGVEDLNIGDIITFYAPVDGYKIIVTHRIIGITGTGPLAEISTQGDNRQTNPDPDGWNTYAKDVVGIYQSADYQGVRIAGVGSALEFLRGKLGFFLCIVLPVLLYTMFQIFKLVQLIVKNKEQEVLESAKEGTSEDVKDAIIREYLAKQAAEKALVEDKKQENQQENK